MPVYPRGGRGVEQSTPTLSRKAPFAMPKTAHECRSCHQPFTEPTPTAKPPCTECGAPHRPRWGGRGLCKVHYSRAYRAGTLNQYKPAPRTRLRGSRGLCVACTTRHRRAGTLNQFRPVHMRQIDCAEDAAFMRDSGETIHGIARRLDRHPRYVQHLLGIADRETADPCDVDEFPARKAA